MDASIAASSNKISLDQKKANSELIKDELLKLETKKQIAQEESDLELTRLQQNIDNAKAGTQARVDAEIAFAEKKNEIDNQILALDDSINIAKLDKEAKARTEKEALLIADYELSKALNEAKFQDELDLYDKTRALERQNIEARIHTAAELEIFDKQTAAGRIAIEKITQETKLSIIENALGAVADAVGRESAAGKAFAVAQAVMNTYSAANKAMSAYPPPFSFIAAGATIVAGLMNVKKIISTPLPNSTGGAGSSVSMSAPVAPPTPQAMTTNLSQSTINDIGNQAVRAYVVESDVSSNQQRIAAIRQRARFS
jgi:hypothetical protein